MGTQGTLAKKLGHILVPLVTPFRRDNGDVNYEEMEKLVDHVITRKFCDSLIVTGTTGEFNTQLYEERVELYRVVKKAAAGRVPLIAGTGAASAREAVRLTQAAEKIGYEVVMVVGPYFCKPIQEGVYRYFEAVAKSVEIPIMLYNIPILTGVNIAPATVARLAKIKNIKGIKDEAGINPTQMTEYALVTPDDFTIYNGDDIMVLCGLAQGAAGVISGGSHLIGDKMRQMIGFFLAGENEKAREIHMALDPLFKSMAPGEHTLPTPLLRAALEMAGHPVGPPRLPLVESTPEEKEVVRKHLVRLGIIQ